MLLGFMPELLGMMCLRHLGRAGGGRETQACSLGWAQPGSVGPACRSGAMPGCEAQITTGTAREPALAPAKGKQALLI